MDTPNDDGERRGPIYRPLSPTLNSHGLPPRRTHPTANPPHPPPATTDTLFQLVSQPTPFPLIRPFRSTNYLNGPGEDLSSQIYMLNADNTWEFSTQLPPGLWNLHGGGGYVHPRHPFQPQPEPQMNLAREWLDMTPHIDPPAPNIPPYPVSPSPIADPNNHRNSLNSGPTSTNATTSKREEKRRGGSHTNDKRFRCDECGKAYSRKAELDRHKRTNKKHNGIGKYPCMCCGRWFTRDDARLRHERMCEVGEGSGSGSGKGKARDVDIDDDEEED